MVGSQWPIAGCAWPVVRGRLCVASRPSWNARKARYLKKPLASSAVGSARTSATMTCDSTIGGVSRHSRRARRKCRRAKEATPVSLRMSEARAAKRCRMTRHACRIGSPQNRTVRGVWLSPGESKSWQMRSALRICRRAQDRPARRRKAGPRPSPQPWAVNRMVMMQVRPGVAPRQAGRQPDAACEPARYKRACAGRA